MTYKHKHLFLTTQKVRLWVGLVLLHTFSYSRTQAEGTALICNTLCCGKEQKSQWLSQIRQSRLKLLLRHSINHIIHISLPKSSHMAKPKVNGKGIYNLTRKQKVKTAINAICQMVFKKDTFSIEMLYL